MHDELVGVKCNWNRECRASHAFTVTWVWVHLTITHSGITAGHQPYILRSFFMSYDLDITNVLEAQSVRDPIEYLCNELELVGSIRLLMEYTDGFTPSRVFLAEQRVTPEDPQPYLRIFKVGPGVLLRDEVGRYKRFIPYARAHSNFVRLFEPDKTLEALPHDDSLGTVAYDYAATPLGGVDCVSLKGLCKECMKGKFPASDLCQIIDTVMNAVHSLYADPKSDFPHCIRNYYLQRWAPDFRIWPERYVVLGEACLLTLHRLDPSYFSRERTTRAEELRRVSEAPAIIAPTEIVIRQLPRPERSATLLKFSHADNLSLSVDISQLSPEARDALAGFQRFAIWMTAEQSRHQFYRRRLEILFPSLDLEAATIRAGGCTLHNPLSHFSEPLEPKFGLLSKTWKAPAHGDLHPGNVIVVGKTPVFIDYGLAEPQLPIGVDSARLFGGLVRDALSEFLTYEELAQVLTAVLGVSGDTSFTDAKLSAAFDLLRTLASRAQNIGDMDFTSAWPIHLYCYSWIALKWDSGSEEAHRAVFLLGAIALTRMLGAPKDEAVASVAPSLEIQQPVPSSNDLDGSLAVQPERPDEILILVTRFSGSADYDATTRVYRALADNVFEIIPGLARVEFVEDSVILRKDAISLANRYRASMVVWGTYDNLGIRPRYEVTRDNSFLTRSMIQLDEITRYQLAEKFEPYITGVLANELTFLSLAAIGQICLPNLYFTQAILVFERALKLVSDVQRVRDLGGFDLCLSLSAAFLATRQYDKALDANAKAQRLAPNNPLATNQQLTILVLRGNQEDFGRIKEALDLLDSQIEKFDENDEQVDALRDLRRRLRDVKSLEELSKKVEDLLPKKSQDIEDFKKGDRRGFKQNVITHLQRAQTFSYEDKFSISLREVTAALRINPICPPALIMRGEILAVTDKVPRALRDFERARTLYPSTPIVYWCFARIYYSNNRLEEALSNVEQAFALGVPRAYPPLFALWGSILIQLGRGDEVMDALKGVGIEPTAPEIYEIRAKYFLQKQQYVLAFENADQLIALAG
jgi:tetratricopeptide (TPR) repeat protein